MYKKKIAYGINNFPWKSVFNKKIYNYNKEKLPIAEEMHKKKFFAIELCLYDLNERDTNYIVNCFKKVWKMLKIK